MRGVRISSLELDSGGAIVVQNLATIFEDGEVVGASYLASSLRKSVAERGPTSLDTIIRRFNNGFYGASWIDKGRVYLKPGEEPPEGIGVHEGPRGGKYYDTSAKRGRPKREWKVGDVVQINGPHLLDYHQAKGKIIGFETTASHKSRDPRDVAVVDVEMPDGEIRRRFLTLEYFVPPGQKLPKKNRAVQRREAMHKARDKVKDAIAARIKGFRETRFDHNEMWHIKVSPYESLDYGMTVDKTEDGIEIWSPMPPEQGQRLDVSEAPRLETLLQGLSYMPPKAIRDLKNYVRRIVLSPARNPRDRELSKTMGTNFISAGTMDLRTRELTLYPSSRINTAEGVASILTHETGHAADVFRESLVGAYNKKLGEFWDKQESMPADPARMRVVEEANDIPPHPNNWMDGYGKWRDFDLGTRNPDIPRFWGYYPRADGGGLMIGEKSWNQASPVEKTIIHREARKSEPVSQYARTSEREYYAEAYEHHRFGNIPKNHHMRAHFEDMERIWKWLTTA